MGEERRQVNATFEPEVYELLKKLAKEEDRNLADMVRVICKRWLKEHGYLAPPEEIPPKRPLKKA